MPKIERIMAFVEAGVAFWLAYPSSLVFGQVLLQTAPPEQAVQMLSFNKAVREVSLSHAETGDPCTDHWLAFRSRIIHLSSGPTRHTSGN